MSANEELPGSTLLLDLPIMRAAVTALERDGFRTARDIRDASSSNLVRVHRLGRKSYQKFHDVIGHDELPRRSHLQPRVAKAGQAVTTTLSTPVASFHETTPQ